MVCTSQTLAAQAGLDVMKRGGNAIDAAIATAICLTVLEPPSNGIGSDLFALVWHKGKLYGLNGSGPAPMALTREKVLEKLRAENRAKDIEFKSTGNGVHREDISFSLNGENVINSASQGQKRMVLLAFKLAIIRYIEQTRHTRAVLLLDDVLSELDRKRQKTLMALIQQPCQCVITGTEFPDYLKTGEYREFCVEEGTITGGNA